MATPGIRPATAADLVVVQEIYATEVRQQTASFEIEAPSLAVIQARWLAVTEMGLPYVVAECDGRIAGYAYATPYRTRQAYCHTLEDSVYVARWARRRGVGSYLLQTLVSECNLWGARQMIAIVGDPLVHQGSVALHQKAGFRRVGVLVGGGHKFDRWLDSLILQRPLGRGVTSPPS